MRKVLSLLAVLFAFTVSPTLAQIEGGGSYYFGDSSRTYTAAVYGDVLGPVDFGAGIFSERAGGAVRVEVPVPLGFYVAGQLVLGYYDSDFGGQWTAGGGYKLHLFGPISVVADVSYRQDDPDLRGFFRTNEGDTNGVQISGKIVLGR